MTNGDRSVLALIALLGVADFALWKDTIGADRVGNERRFMEVSCTPDTAPSFLPMTTTVDRPRREVFVKRPFWVQFGFPFHKDFAAYFSLCEFEGDRVSVRDEETGRVLATYSRQMGYRSLE